MMLWCRLWTSGTLSLKEKTSTWISLMYWSKFLKTLWKTGKHNRYHIWPAAWQDRHSLRLEELSEHGQTRASQHWSPEGKRSGERKRPTFGACMGRCDAILNWKWKLWKTEKKSMVFCSDFTSDPPFFLLPLPTLHQQQQQQNLKEYTSVKIKIKMSHDLFLPREKERNTQGSNATTQKTDK